jgi:restriction endonuclease Mrr
MMYFRRWEEKERRHLVFLDGERLASLLVQLRLGKERENVF